MNKKRLYKIFAIALALTIALTLFLAMPAFATPMYVDGLAFSVIFGNEVQVIGRAPGNNSTSITIPATIDYGGNTYTVVAIGDWAFGIDFFDLPTAIRITTLDLSGATNLTAIGDHAFTFNMLTSVDLSGTNMIDIGYSAFQQNNISTVDLGGLSNLTVIGVNAFGNNAIVNLNLSGLINLHVIDDRAFAGNRIPGLNLSGLTSLTTIGELAFAGNNITNLDLNGLSNLTHIGYFAFSFNPIVNVSGNFPGFTFVTNIADMPATATAGTPLILSGTVKPTDASIQHIVWSVQDAGTTGASISGYVLNATAPGVVTIRATIAVLNAAPFIQDFQITIGAPGSGGTGGGGQAHQPDDDWRDQPREPRGIDFTAGWTPQQVPPVQEPPVPAAPAAPAAPVEENANFNPATGR